MEKLTDGQKKLVANTNQLWLAKSILDILDDLDLCGSISRKISDLKAKVNLEFERLHKEVI